MHPSQPNRQPTLMMTFILLAQSSFKVIVNNICFYNNEFTLNLTEYEANGVIDNSGDEDVDPDSWEQVGPKKKSVLTRKVTF